MLGCNANWSDLTCVRLQFSDEVVISVAGWLETAERLSGAQCL